MALTRRIFVSGLSTLPFASTLARAANWPSGPIRIIVPFPPGGSVDAVGRALSPGLQGRLGANVVIENIGGASGSIGAATAARAQPDGNTWLLVFDTHAINPTLMPNLPFDTKADLVPVYLIGTAPNLLATSPSKPFKTFADVIEAAKKAPDTITYGSIGIGSLGHLTMVRLANAAGVKLVHVPYKGGGPAVTDAIGGHIDLVVGSAALGAPHVKAGKLHPVVQTGKSRLPALSDTQTLAEAGFGGLESHAWWGVFAPKGTPQPTVDRFAGELRAVLGDEKVVSQLVDGQQMTLVNGGADELRTFLNDQIQIWGKIIKDNNIKLDS
ncbi:MULTISPECIES: tripartite tricarboxylate transporter substrate binding protein [Rhodomicrobium]|uniref:Bug family tripartite tricarboxylate transporter substrate binding protein n=1 Tax=Rhodomicrobium TaxID=1068 RepID=UPI000B4C11C1|nr:MULTISPECIES: tripartite tricarboxylate transporter substrate binding protein [Rhodomicrobium]